MRKILLIMSAMLMAVVCGCADEHTSAGSRQSSYRQVASDEAKEMMESSSGYVILDVRTQEEFAAGHIPGAICLPNEEIGKESPAKLKNKDQEIFVYCRSGRRSKEAAQKLADIGYTKVYEFGGINTWEGEIVTGE